VLIGFAETLLRDAGLAPVVLDQNISVLEGSIGVFPRRLAVADEDLEAARQVLREAGLGHELAMAGQRQ
jgi:hypothetical protein